MSNTVDVNQALNTFNSVMISTERSQEEQRKREIIIEYEKEIDEERRLRKTERAEYKQEIDEERRLRKTERAEYKQEIDEERRLRKTERAEYKKEIDEERRLRKTERAEYEKQLSKLRKKTSSCYTCTLAKVRAKQASQENPASANKKKSNSNAVVNFLADFNPSNQLYDEPRCSMVNSEMARLYPENSTWQADQHHLAINSHDLVDLATDNQSQNRSRVSSSEPLNVNSAGAIILEHFQLDQTLDEENTDENMDNTANASNSSEDSVTPSPKHYKH